MNDRMCVEFMKSLHYNFNMLIISARNNSFVGTTIQVTNALHFVARH
jgi:hypothetical protein